IGSVEHLVVPQHIESAFFILVQRSFHSPMEKTIIQPSGEQVNAHLRTRNLKGESHPGLAN
ncbi:MAG: hypothetical protein ABIP71_01045, partial [Verrucomicrobiota bacterium]